MKFMTNRCLVRKFNINDIDNFMQYRNNLEWMKYQSFKGLMKKEYIDELINDNTIYDRIQLAIILKKTNELIGDIFVHRNKNICSIGYTLNPEYCKQGYMIEVIRKLTEVLKNVGVEIVEASSFEENIDSINLLRKLGFEYDGTEDDVDVYLLMLDKIKWNDIYLK